MKNCIILALIITGLTGCHPLVVEGLYHSKKYHKSLLLSNNGTYKYQNGMMHFIEYSKGHWSHFKNGSLVLNSNYKDSLLSNVTFERNEGGKQVIKVLLSVSNKDQDASYFISPIINGRILQEEAISDSMVELYYDYPIDSFQIFIGKMSRSNNLIFRQIASPSIVSNNHTDKIKVTLEIDDRLFGYAVFENDLVYIKRKKVLMYNKHNNKWERLTKIKSNSNVFSSFAEKEDR